MTQITPRALGTLIDRVLASENAESTASDGTFALLFGLPMAANPERQDALNFAGRSNVDAQNMNQAEIAELLGLQEVDIEAVVNTPDAFLASALPSLIPHNDPEAGDGENTSDDDHILANAEILAETDASGEDDALASLAIIAPLPVLENPNGMGEQSSADPVTMLDPWQVSKKTVDGKKAGQMPNETRPAPLDLKASAEEDAQQSVVKANMSSQGGAQQIAYTPAGSTILRRKSETEKQAGPVNSAPEEELSQVKTVSGTGIDFNKVEQSQKGADLKQTHAPMKLTGDLSMAPESNVETSNRASSNPSALGNNPPPSTDGETVLDLMRRDWHEKLGARLSDALERGESDVEIDLYPRALGRLRLNLAMGDGDVIVRVTTETSLAASLLLDGEARLGQSLEAMGLRLAQFAANWSGNGSSQNAFSQGERGQANGGKQPRKHDAASQSETDLVKSARNVHPYIVNVTA